MPDLIAKIVRETALKIEMTIEDCLIVFYVRSGRFPEWAWIEHPPVERSADVRTVSWTVRYGDSPPARGPLTGLGMFPAYYSGALNGPDFDLESFLENQPRLREKIERARQWQAAVELKGE